MAADMEIQPAAVITPTAVKSPAERKAEAEDRVRDIRASAGGRAEAMAVLRQAVALADWDTLGHGSVAEYLDREGIGAVFAEAARRERKLLPDLVAELRGAGLSQEQAGAALGISQGRVSQLERGKTGHKQPQPADAQGSSQAPEQDKQLGGLHLTGVG
jgi:hypothetical protein